MARAGIGADYGLLTGGLPTLGCPLAGSGGLEGLELP
jgi:hypothetical protein